MKIICIDDHPDITDMCKQYLISKGHSCEITNDGKEGLKLIKKIKPDVVLLDLAMPEFSGEDLIKELLKEGPIDGFNIYLFTASSITEKSVGELLKFGVKGYLKKPLHLETLETILQKHE